MKKMRLRTKLLLGWLGLELVALPFAVPAFAVFKDRISFTVPQKVIAVPLPPQPGEIRYLVASNSAFAVVSTGMIGEISVDITPSGTANGVAYGSKSQMPGDAQSCGFPTSQAASRIYTSRDKTAAKRGDITEQAVLVTVRFDPVAAPRIRIETMDETMTSLLAMPCADGRS